MKYLTNAPRKKKRKARFKKGSAAAKRFMASIRPTSKGGTSMAKRKRKTTRKRTTKRRVVRHRTVKRNTPVRHRRRSMRRHRRNPGMKLGFGYFSVKTLLNGAIDAGEVVVGKAAARAIPNLVGLPTSDMTGLIVQGLSAVVVGWAGHSFISPNAGKMMLAGALSAPIESFIKSMNIPFISANLGEDVVEIEGMGTYPQLATPGMGTYVQMGETEYDYNDAT